MTNNKTAHTPRLEARFGALMASVIDTAHPDASRFRSGGNEIAKFPRSTYDAKLAHTLAAAQDLLAALEELEASGLLEVLIGMDEDCKETDEEPIAAPIAKRCRAAIAKATANQARGGQS